MPGMGCILLLGRACQGSLLAQSIHEQVKNSCLPTEHHQVTGRGCQTTGGLCRVCWQVAHGIPQKRGLLGHAPVPAQSCSSTPRRARALLLLYVAFGPPAWIACGKLPDCEQSNPACALPRPYCRWLLRGRGASGCTSGLCAASRQVALWH